MSCDNRKFFEDVSLFWENQESALAYLEKHKLPSRIEDIINYLALTRPKYPESIIKGKLDEYIDEPRLTQIVIQKTYDSEFLSNFSVNLYGEFEDQTILLESTKSSLFSYIENSIGPDNRQNEQDNINNLIHLLQNTFIPSINKEIDNYSLTQQSEIDQMLLNIAKNYEKKSQPLRPSNSTTSPVTSEENKSKKLQKPRNSSGKKKRPTSPLPLTVDRNYCRSPTPVILAISQAVCSSAAQTRKLSSIDYIRKTFNLVEKSSSLVLTLVENIPNGKCRYLNEICLVLSSKEFQRNIENFMNILNHCYYSLFPKINAQTKIFGNRGGLLLCVDRVEQVTDLIKEACLKYEIEINQDLDILMSFHSHLIYDAITERYEVQAGSWKNKDDYLSLLQEVQSKNSVSFLMDPLSQDDNSWDKLAECLDDQSRIIKTTSPHEIEDFQNHGHENPKIIPAFQFSGQNVISDYITAANKWKECSLLFSTPYGDHGSSFPLDLAMAIGFDFIKINVSSHVRTDYIEQFSKLYHHEND